MRLGKRERALLEAKRALQAGFEAKKALNPSTVGNVRSSWRRIEIGDPVGTPSRRWEFDGRRNRVKRGVKVEIGPEERAVLRGF